MINFLVMDIDGTLTDGKIYMGNEGEMFKAFDIKDGCGIKDILPTAGIIPIVITARESKILERRCEELNIIHFYQNIRDKLGKLDSFIEEYNLKNNTTYGYQNIAYIGDDVLDLQCMLPIKAGGGIVGCPKDAVEEVKKICNFVSERPAGNGAVRDFIQFLIEIPQKKNEDKFSLKVQEAVEYLNKIDFKEIETGTYKVNDDFYYMVQEYFTKDKEKCKLESHKKYADIQWIISGEEKIGCCSSDKLTEIEKYDEEKDVIFWKDISNITEIVLRDGSYVVFYPGEAHKPSMSVSVPTKVKKLVAKIRMS